MNQFHCFYCSKPVTNFLPEGSILRAIATCPECIESKEHKIKQPINIERLIEVAQNELYNHKKNQNISLHDAWKLATKAILKELKLDIKDKNDPSSCYDCLHHRKEFELTSPKDRNCFGCRGCSFE